MLKINIQLFAEGGESGASVDVDTTSADDLGQQEDEANQQVTEEQLRTEYEESKKKFKKFYDEDVQSNIRNRFKKNAEEKEANKAYRDKVAKALAPLAAKYGIDAENIDDLSNAINNDNSYWEDAAYREGMGVEEYKHIKGLEQENARLKARDNERAAEEERKQYFEKIDREVAIAKSFYPNLDISKEAENPKFNSYIEKGLDIKTAYEAVHHDDLLKSAVENAAKNVEAKIQGNQNLKNKRPAENINGSSNAIDMSVDVSKMTSEQIRDIAERVRRGETISFA